MAVCVKETKLTVNGPLLNAGITSVSMWFKVPKITTADHSEMFQLSDGKQMLEQQGSRDTKTM